MSASGTVSLANARLSLVAGTAFVDFSSAGTLTPYIGYKLTLTDSAGKKAIGYIKAVGTGETYSAIWEDDCADDGTADWAVNDCTIAFDTDHYVATYVDLTQHIYKAVTLGSGKCLRASLDIKNGATSGVLTYLQINGGLGSNILTFKSGNTTADYATLSGYTTAVNQTTLDIYSTMTGAGNYLFKNYSLSQVLTPSATGVTITSTPNGSTYNWASIESGFNYNDSSGYSYTLIPRTRQSRFYRPFRR